MTLAHDQDRLRRWGFLTDKSGGYGPNTEAAYTAALDVLEKLHPLPAPVVSTIPPHPKVPTPVLVEAIKGNMNYRVPASITLGQWAVESAWGKAESGKWNYGGITARVKDASFPYIPGIPLEPATLCWTHEVVGGKRVKCQRWFKDFSSPADFFEGHSKLLGTSKIYAEARSKLPDVMAFADALDVDYKPHAKDPNWRAYATDPKYAETVKSIIRANNFTLYDGLTV